MVFSGLDGFKLSCFSISIANGIHLQTQTPFFLKHFKTVNYTRLQYFQKNIKTNSKLNRDKTLFDVLSKGIRTVTTTYTILYSTVLVQQTAF